jgi:hypothetical protein
VLTGEQRRAIREAAWRHAAQHGQPPFGQWIMMLDGSGCCPKHRVIRQAGNEISDFSSV